MDRRTLLHSALAGFLGSQIVRSISPALAQEATAPPPGGFSFQTVIDQARDVASRPFERRVLELTAPFADLTYDQFRAIRFRDEARLFTEDQRGFQMDMLPPGFYFRDRIAVNLVENGTPRELPFSTDYFTFHPDYFDYPDGRAPSDLATDLSFSGLRFRRPINQPGVWDEVAVFQGASYFRAVARGTLYGLSARGLAIGTAGPDPEEFPIFTAFWVHVPGPGEQTLRLHAMLDGPSVAGAYEFLITPGAETIMDVRCVLFPRVEIATVGIAALTSMYFFGPDNRAGIDDFRDAVHDSDGLMIHNGGGEQLWRPLRNPSAVEVSAFLDENPRAFGLIQRNREFTHFDDAEASYERRPSAWIEPFSDWGRGAVNLVELPTADEFSDNVVAFWRPEAPLAAGAEHRFDYRLTWGSSFEHDRPLARVVATRSGLSILDATERVFVVDFDLGQIAFPDLVPRLRASGGEIRGLSISPLPEGNVARVGFHFVAGTLTSSEFRMDLTGPSGPVSEVWLYRWTAAAGPAPQPQ